MSIPTSVRILVTGGTGFIGRYVLELLVSDGHRPLVTTNNNTITHRLSDSFTKVDVLEIDLTDALRTDDLIESFRPQILIHLAGATGHGDPTGKICHDLNYTATTNLLTALDKRGLTRAILIGSAAEYGRQRIPFREDMPSQPVSHYAVSKAMANKFALDLHAKSGFPVTILRVFTAFGYGQPDKMFFPQLIMHGLLNRHFTMSDGMQKRDFVSVRDVAVAIKAAMTAENAVGRIINIGSGQGVVLKELAQTVWEMCGADSELLEIGARGKSGDDAFDTEADIGLAKQVLNWQPESGGLADAGKSKVLAETIMKMKSDSEIEDNH